MSWLAGVLTGVFWLAVGVAFIVGVLRYGKNPEPGDGAINIMGFVVGGISALAGFGIILANQPWVQQRTIKIVALSLNVILVVILVGIAAKHLALWLYRLAVRRREVNNGK